MYTVYYGNYPANVSQGVQDLSCLCFVVCLFFGGGGSGVAALALVVLLGFEYDASTFFHSIDAAMVVVVSTAGFLS